MSPRRSDDTARRPRRGNHGSLPEAEWDDARIPFWLCGSRFSEVGRSALVYARQSHRECGRSWWVPHCRSKSWRRGRLGRARWAPPRWSPCQDLGSCNGIGGHRAAEARFRGTTPDHGARKRGGRPEVWRPGTTMSGYFRARPGARRSWAVFGVPAAPKTPETPETPKSGQDLESCAHKRGTGPTQPKRWRQEVGFWGKGGQSGGAHRARPGLPRRNVLDLPQAPTHHDHTPDGCDERRQARSAQPRKPTTTHRTTSSPTRRRTPRESPAPPTARSTAP
jgi:hypothetical protein